MGGEFREHLRQPGEVASMCDENFRPETKRAETSFRLRQLNRVGVKAEQLSARREPRENFPRMAAVAKGAIHSHFAGLWGEQFKNLLDVDGAVRSSKSLAGREDFFHR